MINKFENIKNYDDVFFREVMVSLCHHYTDKIFWFNKFDSGEMLVEVPFFTSLSGDKRFLENTYINDIPNGSRVDYNIDSIPRVMCNIENINVIPSEQNNTSVKINVLTETSDGLLKQAYTESKKVPVEINVNAKVIVDSEIDAYKFIQRYIDVCYLYKYIAFTYKSINVVCIVESATDLTFNILREGLITDKNRIEFTLPIKIKTDYHVINIDDSVLMNKRVKWKNNLITDK